MVKVVPLCPRKRASTLLKGVFTQIFVLLKPSFRLSHHRDMALLRTGTGQAFLSSGFS